MLVDGLLDKLLEMGYSVIFRVNNMGFKKILVVNFDVEDKCSIVLEKLFTEWKQLDDIIGKLGLEGSELLK